MKSNVLQTPEERVAAAQETMRKVRVACIWLLVFNIFVLCFNVVLKLTGESKDFRLIAGSIAGVIFVSSMLVRSTWLFWTLFGVSVLINTALIMSFFLR